MGAEAAHAHDEIRVILRILLRIEQFLTREDVHGKLLTLGGKINLSKSQEHILSFGGIEMAFAEFQLQNVSATRKRLIRRKHAIEERSCALAVATGSGANAIGK